MRVLQLGPFFNNHLRRWSAHALALGCTVYAAGHVRPGKRPVDLTGLAAGVDVLPGELVYGAFERQLTWLRGLLETVRPDLVHAHWLPRWGYLATASGHRSVVVTPWGSDLYLATGADRARANRALVEAEAVLARSPHMKREMIGRGAVPSRIKEVDLGVDLDRFRPVPPRERARLKAELGLPPGPVVLSFRVAGELYNLDVVIDGFRILRARIPDAGLVLVHGDTPLAPVARRSLRELADIPGIRIVGAVAHSEMPAYLGAADVGVSIPASDGSPSSVWEALACGLPVVLSKLPQIEERVGRSGAATLVEPRRDDVAAALAEILSDRALRERMAGAGRGWAVENVDERRQIMRLGQVYAATVTRSTGRSSSLPIAR